MYRYPAERVGGKRDACAVSVVYKFGDPIFHTQHTISTSTCY